MEKKEADKLELVIYETKDNIAWITMNRPEVLNAQNEALRAELIAALEKARDDEEVYIIVLTGAGGRAFSAGADISEFPLWAPIDVIRRRKGKKSHYGLPREIPKPVIAMVNGLALGGGGELAMACDIIVASEDAQFGQPEINIGVIPGGGATQLLPRLVGEKKAKELIFTGEFISAGEALRLGLVNRVVPKEKLKEAVIEIISKLKRKSPAILQLAKLAVNKSLETPLSVGMADEANFFAMCFGTEDQKEGARAFLEKRKPNYIGK